eukprot:6207743-Pleurochrysis_carterae.AAC.2
MGNGGRKTLGTDRKTHIGERSKAKFKKGRRPAKARPPDAQELAHRSVFEQIRPPSRYPHAASCPPFMPSRRRFSAAQLATLSPSPSLPLGQLPQTPSSSPRLLPPRVYLTIYEPSRAREC